MKHDIKKGGREEAEFDDGVSVSQFPERRRSGDEARRESDDKVGFKPVFPLSFIQDNLQRAQTQGEQAEADVINLNATLFLL